MSKFYLNDTPSSTSSTSSLDLPYPAPLPRSDFLSPDFLPSLYLSTLRNRHQTLEDLRAELRSRSQLLSRELLDLVNAHYSDFLSLGSSLTGGDEKVEEVRVGLLGFRKEVEGLRRRVEERRGEVEGLVRERVGVRREVTVGRALLDVNTRLEELEEGLMVESAGKTDKVQDGQDAADVSDSEELSDEDEEDEGGGAAFMSLSKLQRQLQQYMVVRQLTDHVGLDHPFLVAQKPRMTRVRSAILLDLSAALKQAYAAGDAGQRRVMNIMALYRDMDEAREAIGILKGLNKRR
ncbi:hypothetical protein W97_02174 [Coniosporium apollinis CBS 100218]|uniref:Conserved oligomeric Golgi complex subunit 2 n=1 Tax=Coniosporium apollinis (strain CBS 100218) TaxID=1168221 RepID=R7YM52_CONA1|nr:uncharacterized protein W97_02174 [Coniosporium apollinis CBS 100218]EON62948.1 hypothetical protein W97_02174 [Coniosporium apollinis CBS 100218]